MMKKLLVLVLVLGLTSVSHAALSGIELSFNGQTDGAGNITETEVMICDEIVIDVHGPAGLDWLGYVIIEGAFPGAGGEWGDDIGPWDPMCSGYYYENQAYPIILSGAGDIAKATRYTEVGWGFGYELIAAQSEGPNPGGVQFELIYHCCGPETEWVTISLWDDAQGYTTPQDTILIHQTPEPMTVALLGLGGLFLLRRRK
jgi:hypothetical protein